MEVGIEVGMVDGPTHDDYGTHVDWKIETHELDVGDVWLFEANAGALLKHAAAVRPGALSHGGGAISYVVFDLHLSTTAPMGIARPPPPSLPVCSLASPDWWPDDFEAHSMEFWAAYREERSAFSFLSG